MTTVANIVRTDHAPVLLRENTEQAGLSQLEVNVIFTDLKATALALKTACGLAANLNACIRMRAAFAVPLRLPLDHPHISIAFMEKVLCDLVSELPDDGPEITGHLYLCRERIATFSQVLYPNSLVVIAGRMRPWRTTENRIAQHLQSEGHRVILVPFGRKS